MSASAVFLSNPRGSRRLSFRYRVAQQQTGRDAAVVVAEDALVDLHLIGGADLGVVRLESRRVHVVVVALHRAVRVQPRPIRTRPHRARRARRRAARRGARDTPSAACDRRGSRRSRRRAAARPSTTRVVHTNSAPRATAGTAIVLLDRGSRVRAAAPLRRARRDIGSAFAA